MTDSINCRPYHLTDLLFKTVVMEAYPVEGKDLFSSDTAIGKEAFTYEERNVLRFVGGYMLKALKKKLERSAHTEKNWSFV